MRSSSIAVVLAITSLSRETAAVQPDAPCSREECLEAAMGAIENHDIRRAQVMYARGCSDGVPAGCSMFARLFSRNAGVRELASEADKILGAACASGSKQACGDYVQHAANPDQMLAEQLIVNLWQRACYPAGDEPLDAVACDKLASHARIGKERAAYLQRACGGGHEGACASLAVFRSCYPPPNTKIDALACYTLAQRADADRAERYLTRACDAGAGVACSKIAERLLQEVPSSAQLERAEKYYELGCRHGDKGACRWVQLDRTIPGPAFFVAHDSIGVFATGGLPIRRPSPDARGLQLRVGAIVTDGDFPATGEFFYAGSYSSRPGHGFGFRSGYLLLSLPRADESTWSLVNLAVQWDLEAQWFRDIGFEWSHGPVIQNRVYLACAWSVVADVVIPLRHTDLFGPTIEAGIAWGSRDVSGPGYSRCSEQGR